MAVDSCSLIGQRPPFDHVYPDTCVRTPTKWPPMNTLPSRRYLATGQRKLFAEVAPRKNDYYQATDPMFFLYMHKKWSGVLNRQQWTLLTESTFSITIRPRCDHQHTTMWCPLHKPSFMAFHRYRSRTLTAKTIHKISLMVSYLRD